MRTFLETLLQNQSFETKDLIKQLGVTDEEYSRIESGELQVSLPQIIALTELVKTNTNDPRVNPIVAIYNYNLGSKSRAINYPATYTENDYTNKPQNHETTNSQTTE